MMAGVGVLAAACGNFGDASERARDAREAAGESVPPRDHVSSSSPVEPSVPTGWAGEPVAERPVGLGDVEGAWLFVDSSFGGRGIPIVNRYRVTLVAKQDGLGGRAPWVRPLRPR